MRVLVCGGRNYDNLPVVARVLELLHKKTPIAVLIHGPATGADTLADGWAFHKGHPGAEVPHGAGRPELVIAFPGRGGTGDMLIRAVRAQLPWVHVDHEGMLRGPGKRYFAT